jgi:conjugative transposon TraN protein
MKNILALLILSLNGFSQTVIPAYHLSVTDQKTTNLIFPYRIEKADIGSPDVIGHSDEKLENVLFLKAAVKNSAPTNLSVYTSDGRFYSFNVLCKEDPDTLNISFMKVPEALLPVNEEKLDRDASLILQEQLFLHRKTGNEGVRLRLNGIYLKDQLIWFRMDLKNNSAIEYQTEHVRFFIQPKHQTKRTASQEIEKTPVWLSKDRLLLAFPAFTIEKNKELGIQVREKNGGRQLDLNIPSRVLLRSQIISNHKN